MSRIKQFPEEKEENLPKVNGLLFNYFPDLKSELLENGIEDPYEWYMCLKGKELVLEKIRRSDLSV